MPILKLPFHFSYLLYIATYSPALALLYFRSALALCRILHIEPSLLLHPLDFLGSDDVPELAFFPAMRCMARRKTELLARIIRRLNSSCDVSSMGRHSVRAQQSRRLKDKRPTDVLSPSRQPNNTRS